MTRAALLVSLGAMVFAGCATPHKPAPVADRTPSQARVVAPSAAAVKPAPRPQEAARPETYVVKPGDTLYSIALDQGLDYRELAAWNNVDNVSVIHVGQQLRLTPPPSTITTAPLKAPGGKVESRPLDARGPASKPAVASAPPVAGVGERLKTGPKAARVPYSEQAWAQANKAETAAPAKLETKPEPAKPEPKSEAAREGDDLDWIWPTSGRVVSSFSDTANLKGVGIAGKAGQPVYASAPGRVVYSGSGLRGYGKLIIIKHNATYLSVYAHNSELLVKEGQNVAKGQKIAEMGNTDSDTVKLHFEIRRLGKPVDPLKLLPDRG
ncbi:MAG: peptidoglycan DD-metalloendopeptidase family protein [Rhodospirillaceae bacterium]